MKAKGYLVFHLNLAFSSIEENERVDVIKKCYHSLLDLIEQTGIPIGIELTGWTLKQIELIDNTWVKRFKRLLSSGKCELIGSGYCQIIGPLVPFKVNEWNQRLGLDIYKEILDCKPNIILVNEMAFSSSLVDLYSNFGYKGLIMDRDNVRSALDRLNDKQIVTKIFEESFDVFLNRDQNAKLVYFDPPYDFFYSKQWALKPYSKAVKLGGYFMMEHPKREPRQVPEKLDGMSLIQTRKYGKSSISIFQA